MSILAARRALDDALLRIDAAFERLCERRLLAPLGVVALAALVMFFDLGGAEICESNEAVEALGVREMVERGRWIVPLLNGQEPMFKPPLFHWCATAISHLAGASQVSEWTVRAPAALFAVATVALCLTFVTLALGRAHGVLAGLILVGAYPFVDQGRYGRVDMVLTFFETLSLFSFVWCSDARRRTLWHYVLALALGLGVLAKGPVGALLPALSIAIFLLWEGRSRELRALFAPGPVVVFLVVASSWYLACALSRDWPALDRQLGSENFGRFFGSLGRMPLTYYVAPFLLSSVPFSLLAPFVVVRALRWRRGEAPSSDDGRATARWPALLAVFSVVTFVFFSVAAYKRRAYLLPMWPALSALVPWWLGTVGNADARRKLTAALVTAAAVLVAVNAVYAPYKERRDCPAGVVRAVAAQINQAVPASQPIYLQGVSVDDAAPLLFYLGRTSPIISTQGPASPAIVFAESWAGSPSKSRILATSGTGWKRLLVVESTGTLEFREVAGARRD